MQIGEVAAPATRNQDLLADAIGALEDDNTTPATYGAGGAHQASGTGAQHNRIEVSRHLTSVLFRPTAGKC
jgi:hypothetical protein